MLFDLFQANFCVWFRIIRLTSLQFFLSPSFFFDQLQYSFTSKKTHRNRFREREKNIEIENKQTARFKKNVYKEEQVTWYIGRCQWCVVFTSSLRITNCIMSKSRNNLFFLQFIARLIRCRCSLAFGKINAFFFEPRQCCLTCVANHNEEHHKQIVWKCSTYLMWIA